MPPDNSGSLTAHAISRAWLLLLLCATLLLLLPHTARANTTVDMWQTFEGALTSAGLAGTDNNTSLTSSNWTVTNASGDLSIGAAGEKTSPSKFNNIVDNGSAGLIHNMANGNAGYIDLNFLSAYSAASWGFWVKVPSAMNGCFCFSNIFVAANPFADRTGYLNLLADGGGPYFELTTNEEGGSDPININAGQWYWVTIAFTRNKSDGWKVRVYDETGRLVGPERTRISADKDTDALSLGMIVSATVSGNTVFDDLVMDWTDATFPLRPFPSSLLKPPNNLGLVGYWSFNEGTGTVATDFSGNGNHAALNDFSDPPTGTSGWTNGKRGKALNFDNNDDVVVTTATNIIPPNGSFTAAVWARQTANDGDSMIFQGESGNDNGAFHLMHRGSGNGYRCGFWGNDLNSSTAYADSNWHHIVCTYDATTNARTIYVDGVADNNDTAAADFDGTGPLYIGSFDDGEDAFGGTLDEVRVYNRALSPTEVAKLYGSGAVKFTTSSVELQHGSTLANGLVGHWTFDGPDTTTTIADRSGQDNHGYFQGGATSSAKVAGKLGQGLNFDGVDDFVSVSNFNMSSTFSVAAWVYLRSAVPTGSPQGILSHDDFCFFGIDEDDNLVNWNNGGAGSGTFGAFSSGVWHHVVFTNSGSSLTAYLDGAQSMGPVSSTFECPGAATTKIGMNGADNEGFDGPIDDVRLYNRALSPAEVQQLYRLGQVIIRP